MEKLTIQEEDAMRVIWQVGHGFIKDFLEQFPDPKPPYTTLASVVKNLERKLYIKGRKHGNIYEYTPLIEEREYKKKFMSGFVRDYFKSSYQELVTFFIREQEMSPDELKKLIDIIEQEK